MEALRNLVGTICDLYSQRGQSIADSEQQCAGCNSGELHASCMDEDLTVGKLPISELHIAAAEGDVHWIKEIVRGDCDINMVCI